MSNQYKPEGTLIASAENKDYISSVQGLERALIQGKILEGIALLCDSESNLHIDLNGIRGFIEREECIYTHSGEEIKDIAIITRVGKPVCFKVMRIEHDALGPFAILSRREAQRECYEYYLSELISGDIIPAKITHLENFGAFADIGCGIPSLMSIDCISVSRIAHPKNRLSVGIDIHAVVKSIDRFSGRIFISLRELLGTWLENAAEFRVGSTVAGIIRSVESYGVFVELSPNLAGLAEIKDSDIQFSCAEDLIGCRSAVYIKNIIPEKMKIKLVLVDCIGTQAAPSRIKYYIDTSRVRHIDRWSYSPPECSKSVESIFERGR